MTATITDEHGRRYLREIGGKRTLLPSSLELGDRIEFSWFGRIVGTVYAITTIGARVRYWYGDSVCDVILTDNFASDLNIALVLDRAQEKQPMSETRVGAIELKKVGGLSYRFICVNDGDGQRWALLPSSLRVGQRVSVSTATHVYDGIVTVVDAWSAERCAFVNLDSGDQLRLSDADACFCRISVENDPTFASEPDSSPGDTRGLVNASTNSTTTKRQPTVEAIKDAMRRLPVAPHVGSMVVLLLGQRARQRLLEELSEAPTPEGIRAAVMSSGLAGMPQLFGAELDQNISDWLMQNGKIEQDDVFAVRVHGTARIPPNNGYASMMYQDTVAGALETMKASLPRKTTESAAAEKTQTAAPTPTAAAWRQSPYATPPAVAEAYCGVPTLTPTEIQALRTALQEKPLTDNERRKIADAFEKADDVSSLLTLPPDMPIGTLIHDTKCNVYYLAESKTAGYTNWEALGLPTTCGLADGQMCVVKDFAFAVRDHRWEPVPHPSQAASPLTILTPREILEQPSSPRGLADDVHDTAWRVGATQTVEAIKAALTAGTRALSSAALKRHVKSLAESPWGSAALAAAASALLAIGAPEGGKRARLSEELRIKAMTDASNEAIGSLVYELSALLDGGTVATIIDSIELPPPEPTVRVDFSSNEEPAVARNE